MSSCVNWVFLARVGQFKTQVKRVGFFFFGSSKFSFSASIIFLESKLRANKLFIKYRKSPQQLLNLHFLSPLLNQQKKKFKKKYSKWDNYFRTEGVLNISVRSIQLNLISKMLTKLILKIIEHVLPINSSNMYS
jgi:hypothetical protein